MGLLPSLGARLAKLTSNPLLMITDGEARILQGAPPLGVTQDVVEGWMPFRLVLEAVVPYGKRHVMMGATQVDREGNQNISAIGDWAKPKRQLLGVRGAPGNTVNNKTSYWVPKHSTRVFVEHVDIVSGVGRARAEAAGPAATRFHQVHRVVSDLGVFDFGGPGHTMQFVSVHPGVTVEDVQDASSFAIHRPDDVPLTREPSPGELMLIRDMLDPKGLRDREVPPWRRSSDRPAAADAADRAGRRTPPRRADGHGLGRGSPTGGRYGERRRARHPGQRHDDARGARAGDRGGEGPHRPAVRRQPARRRR